MAQDTPSRHLDQFMLRLPDGMRDRLKAEAEANNRSMNAEIVARLKSSLEISNSDGFDQIDHWLKQSNPDTSILLHEIRRQAQSNLATTMKLIAGLEKLGLNVFDPDKNARDHFLTAIIEAKTKHNVPLDAEEKEFLASQAASEAIPPEEASLPKPRTRALNSKDPETPDR
ncbi:Arc family DNA-binding protein [Methylobacterium sp. NEAU 140]|uniref:Arc family DNA-binding protein n=1 Tax=Methylobacterium sp. NEAU 140 TaxID=3064945 RepID=UPI0027371BFD|nr:Arc family DNA-binding protein [Methylobacterium sp. NEAU 140]MDP4022950.1 Arc family DNA-binding protein [Methylobacterium sp. NEAU 140]